MRIEIASFTQTGYALGEKLQAALQGMGDTAELTRCGEDVSVYDWVSRHFNQVEALVFVGAVGIAVRAVAPHLRSKLTDPAVVVLDERAGFAIPLLSGHVGGANRLAQRLSHITGAVPVVTTATDLHGAWAVDSWAKSQRLCIANPSRIKAVSSKILEGNPVSLYSEMLVVGHFPPPVFLAEETESCDVYIGIHLPPGDALHLVPSVAVLGVGCKKGIPADVIEMRYQRLLKEHNLHPAAIRKVCTINMKQHEPGLVEFCKNHGLPLEVFSLEQLEKVEGCFCASEFVRRTTGVDNVCERSAVLGSAGRLAVPKTAGEGVTMAIAVGEFSLEFEVKE
ncbi:cobalt-precorrin 5A hydrolase [Oscillospiraceae bacterium MB08-C2-2]|nr:cobalt-precorrin 5A hydrolase [Oscillospiraceae bacterium MB08-C2-2]